MVKSNKGRKKIEMRKIQKESSLQVSFSKRRFGIFKKASELCTLCGVEILLLIFSPGGKIFSFGHPSVRNLIERFSIQYQNSIFPHQHNNNLVEVRRDGRIQYFNDILSQMLLEQEKEKQKRVFLNYAREYREQRGNWYEKDIKELDMNQTENLIISLEAMKNKLIGEISQNSQINNVPHSYYLGESSSRNVIGIDLYDQRSNTLDYNPNMVLPNYGPSFGYNRHEIINPRFNFN